MLLTTFVVLFISPSFDLVLKMIFFFFFFFFFFFYSNICKGFNSYLHSLLHFKINHLFLGKVLDIRSSCRSPCS